jgi:hypothetical protein
MKKVGYLEGTDPVILTRLTARGVDTYPLGNGADNHGKYIGFIDRSDNIALVVGYLHKVVPLTEQTTPQDLLRPCQLNKIPVLLIVPSDLHENVRQMPIMRGLVDHVQLVDPADVMTEARKILGV